MVSLVPDSPAPRRRNTLGISLVKKTAGFLGYPCRTGQTRCASNMSWGVMRDGACFHAELSLEWLIRELISACGDPSLERTG
jgi:hypothetical protein